MASAADIQNIVITDAFTVHKPSRHIEYTIQGEKKCFYVTRPR